MRQQPDTAQTRLQVVDPTHGRIQDHALQDLPGFLRTGDVVVLNDAATLPASVRARTERDEDIELRLLGPEHAGVFSAVVFGAGDYHTRTEDRAAPPELQPGERLRVGPQLTATVISRSSLSLRLIEIRFDQRGAALWRALYAWGKPVQYAYQPEPVALWSVQTAYAARPWASEMPSAGRPLKLEILLALAARGVHVVTLTHAAGLSSTGDPAIDRALPLPERYDLPAHSVRAIEAARSRGGRVIAVGTSVVRALESANLRGQGQLVAGEATSHLRITPAHELQVVDGLLTGIHSPEESHFELLGAFVDDALLNESHAHARAQQYREHEWGDECLILADSLAADQDQRDAA